MTQTIHAEMAGENLAVTWELDLNDVTVARFARLVVERRFEHLSHASWPTERMSLEAVFEHALATLRDKTERAAMLDLTSEVGDECLAHLSLIRGRVELRLAARSVDTLAAAKTWAQSRYPVTEPSMLQRAQISFWATGERGARRNTRQIDVPSWAEIRDNYAAAVAVPLDALMAERFEHSHSGRLVLWHGEPGTGKTFALRALAWEWRSWCRFQYITDPEQFFGNSPRYMLDVLLDGEDDDDNELWRLLILEDTGELLAADAKYQTGQGLSRLLNVVDGLLGQGLRILVLVTTNDPLRTLHPAVTRPGRCASRIEFVPFTPEEATEWYERHGADGQAHSGTLASLYARSAGVELPERPRVGFVR